MQLTVFVLAQEKIRTAQLEESIQQTDRLLFQMIPKPIADKLRQGEPPLNTCREFSSVSILFSDIVSFTPMCSRLHPMEVVGVLNAMYVAFDSLCEVHNVYKVRQMAGQVVCLELAGCRWRPLEMRTWWCVGPLSAQCTMLSTPPTLL